jgi:hypothetical protein
VYALRVQQIEQDVRAEQIVAATLIAARAEGVEIPTVQAALEQFDADLLAPLPKQVKAQDRQLRKALGVRAA